MNIYHTLRSSLVLGALFVGLMLLVSGSPDVAAGPEVWASNAGWTEIGVGSATGRGITDTNFHSHYPALAAMGDKAVLAWTELIDGSDNEIYVKRWDGTKWVEFSSGSASGGGISNNSGNSWQTAITIDQSGQPVVAWFDRSDGGYQIYVKRWNGENWVQLGSSATGGGISNTDGRSQTPSLVSTKYGIVVAWADDEEAYEGGYQIYVRRWDAYSGYWAEMGSWSASHGIGISDNAEDSYFPSIAVDGDGNPVIAWAQNYCGQDYVKCPSEIYVKRWDDYDEVWRDMGGSASGGGISNNLGISTRPTIAVDSAGTIIVAWQDDSSGVNQIYAKRWNEYYSVWVEMDDSASGGGISKTSVESRYPSLAIDPNGPPVVAWQDGPACIEDSKDCEDEIFVRRWNAERFEWEEMDRGSASGSGISNDITGYSNRPSLAFTSKGVAIVAWRHTEHSGTAPDQIYGRRYTSCYELTLLHTGQGSDPVPDPDSSAGCPPGSYTPGTKIVLTAAPAPGWWVAGWDGTDNNGSTAETNSLTMPMGNHTASVEYTTSCYALTLKHEGDGSDPIPVPANSPKCLPGRYEAGEQITLTAVPGPGSRVSAWSGTDHNASTAETNSLTMPAADHIVTVSYTLMADFVPMVCFDCSRGPTELEPNNQIGQSNGPLCEGSVTIQGWPNDTWDYFKFNVGQSKEISVVVTNHHGGGTQIALYYQWIGVSYRKAIDTVAEDGLEIDYKNAEPGTYYITIYTAAPKPEETRPYTLQVTSQ